MIPKTCPISDKMKLRETLKGECEFACIIPDKFCFGCSFHEARLRELRGKPDGPKTARVSDIVW